MGDNPQPVNVEEHEHQENVEEPQVPPHLHNDVPPEEGQAEEAPPQLLNVREVILPPLPPVNGLVQIPNGPGNHQEVLLNLEEHLGRYINLADLIGRNEPAIDLDEIRDLLDAIDIVEEEENAENRHHPGIEVLPDEKNDDSDESDVSDESDAEEPAEPAPPAVENVQDVERAEKD